MPYICHPQQKTLWLFRLASNALGNRLEKRFQKILESVAGVTNRCTFAARSRDRRKEEKFFTYWFKKQGMQKILSIIFEVNS